MRIFGNCISKIKQHQGANDEAIIVWTEYHLHLFFSGSRSTQKPELQPAVVIIRASVLWFHHPLTAFEFKSRFQNGPSGICGYRCCCGCELALWSALAAGGYTMSQPVMDQDKYCSTSCVSKEKSDDILNRPSSKNQQ